MTSMRTNLKVITSDYLKSILNAIEDPVRIISTNKDVIVANNAMVDIFKDKAVQCCNGMWGDSIGHNCAFEMLAKTNDSVKFERWFGGKFYSMTAAPVFDNCGRKFGIIEIYKDVTKYITIQEKLMSANMHLIKNLEMGKKLQRSLLRKEMPNLKEYRFSYGFFPCEEIGGDMFDCLEMKDGRIVMYIADVSGHGAMAAMMTVFLKQQIVSAARIEGISSGEILKRLNAAFGELDAIESMYITIFLSILNPHTGEIAYSNAGHSVSPIMLKNSKTYELDISGEPISTWFEHVEYSAKKTVMSPGDRIILFTDGLVYKDWTENIKPKFEKAFASEEFNVEKFLNQIEKWHEENLNDDLTAFICERVKL